MSTAKLRDAGVASPIRRHRLAILILMIQAALLGWEAHRNSIVWDEVAWLPSGISHWTMRQFDLGRVNPPLVRMIAAVPVLLASDAPPAWSDFPSHPLRRLEHDVVGRQFVNETGEKVFWYYTLARWACIPLTLAGGWFAYRWGTELYGPSAGVLTLILWCFSPMLLAHGQLMTPDAGAAAMGVVAHYLFWRWLLSLDASTRLTTMDATAPSTPAVGRAWKHAAYAGIGLGLVELTKTTWIILFGLWPCLWMLWRLTSPGSTSVPIPPDSDHTRPTRGKSLPVRIQLAQMALILVLGVYGINLGYGFEGSGTPLRNYTFTSEILRGGTRHNRFADSLIGNVPVPLPRNYVQGIDTQKSDFDRKLWSYLRGEWRLGGWWYYYLYALVIKSTLGFWLVAGLAVALRLARYFPGEVRRHELVLLGPTVIVLALVSCQTGFNHHLRYILPALPFLFIFVGQAAIVFRSHETRTGDQAARVPGTPAAGSHLPLRHPWLRRLVVLGGSSAVVSSLWIFPHSTTYFNELVGGPWGGPQHLLESNVDWGQDLLHFRRWLDDNPDVQPIGFSYVVPLIDPAIVRIRWESIPPGPDAAPADQWHLSAEELAPQPGWFAIAVNHIHDRKKQYSYFRKFTPVATAGYSIYIYHITTDEANQVRREYGLPLLREATATRQVVAEVRH